MRPLGMAAICTMLAMTGVQAADLTENDVILKIQVEHLAVVRGLSPVIHEDVTGMAFSEQAMAAGAVNIQPGDYTLLVECYAPAGDADGFFVEIDGKQTRRTAPIGRWGTLAYPFAVQQAGALSFAVIGQEPGMTVDAIAIVRGTHKDNDPRLAQVPGEMQAGIEINLADVPRLTLDCRLDELPDAPFERDEQTVYLEHFEEECLGASGENHPVEGRFGLGIYLGVPDGRFAIDVAGLGLGAQGTVEWWMRPRPAQELWSDQGWHYFLHARSSAAEGLQLDLSRHPRTQLRLVASAGEGPYYTPTEFGSREWVQISTNSLEEGAWHHVLVSWDLSGEREHLWLLVDGVGKESFFPKAHDTAGFATIELGNTPSAWEVPYLPIDGAIDEVRIRNVSVAGRLAQ